MTQTLRKPEWLRKKMNLHELREMKSLLREHNVHTVCESASCPNMSECFKKRTATFMIMGDICTRGCRFCGVTKSNPLPLDKNETKNIVKIVNELGLEYVVITSVTRDDIHDGGAGHFADVVGCVRKECKKVKGIEVLVPDFYARAEQKNLIQLKIKLIIEQGISVFGHNIETVPRLYKKARQGSDYQRSLDVLSAVKNVDENCVTKSGIMLGLGETREEIIDALRALKNAGCDIVLFGQYLAPSNLHISVERYVDPSEFLELENIALDMGFRGAQAGPYVRSSYKAMEIWRKICSSNVREK
ncbi:MAG: lipoyl synthase [Elusimicrobiota bacterium]